MTYYWLNLLKKTLKHEEKPEGNKSERFILRERGYYKSWIINNILIYKNYDELENECKKVE